MCRASFGLQQLWIQITRKKNQKKQRIVAVTHVIASPIWVHSIKQDMELVMLQKEENVKYFQSRNNLTYIVDCFKHSSATLKPCAVIDSTESALNRRFVLAEFFTHKSCPGLLRFVFILNVFLNVSAADSKNRKGKGELLQAPQPGRVRGTRGKTCGLDIRRLCGRMVQKSYSPK